LNTDGDEITVKLTDFGLSVPLNNIAPVPSMLSSRKTGTVLYMPPEINISSSPSIYYTDAIDVWSLGCVIAEIELEVRLFDMNDEIASRMNLSYTYATEPIEAAMILTYVILGTPTAETWPGFNETNRTLIGSYTPHLKWLDKLCTQESKTAIPMCLKYYQFDRPTAREILDIYS
jgi:serine/threonine protein kinase